MLVIFAYYACLFQPRYVYRYIIYNQLVSITDWIIWDHCFCSKYEFVVKMKIFYLFGN